MSTIVRYSSGSTYTLVPNKVDIEKVQDLDGQYHIPNTSIVGMLRLGLGVQRITVSGDALDMSACLWHDVVAISFDSGTSYQTVYFAGVPYSSDCWSGIYPYALSLLASPLKEQTAVRYPTTGYEWGNQSITGISQAGNVSAYPIIHFLAPLFYAPLSNTLLDFTGQSVTFTRTAAKYHGSILYPINTPIFDSGLYLASDTAQDWALWTPPASAVRTVAMQIKSRYPSPWLIGGGGVNLLTPNQSNAETDTTGWVANSGTLTRNTTTPIAGTGDFLLTANGGADCNMSTTTKAPVTAGTVYLFSALVHAMWHIGVAQSQLNIYWYQADGTTLIGNTLGSQVDTSGGATRISVCGLAPAGAGYAMVRVYFPLAINFEPHHVDILMIEAIPAFLTIWTSAQNMLRIDTVNNRIQWTDVIMANVFLTLPAAYMTGTVMDVVVIDDTSHAVTIAVHPGYGSWTSASGTLALLTWPQLTLGNLEGSIAELIQYPYVLAGAEYTTLEHSSLSLQFNTLGFNTLYIGNRYAGEIIKGSDKRLVNALGSDISALLGGVDTPIGSAAVTIEQSQGMSARWYVEVKRTDV